MYWNFGNYESCTYDISVCLPSQHTHNSSPKYHVYNLRRVRQKKLLLIIFFFVVNNARCITSCVSPVCPQSLTLHINPFDSKRPPKRATWVYSSLPFVIILKCRSLLSWHKALRKEFYGENPKSSRFVSCKQHIWYLNGNYNAHQNTLCGIKET